MSNSITIVGNLGGDPEVKQTNGGPLLKFSLASNQRVNGPNGWQDQTVWFAVAWFGKRAEALGKLLHRGSTVSVVGELSPREYEARGVKRTSLDVNAYAVDLVSSGGGSREQGRSNGGGRRREPNPDDDGRDPGDPGGDDIPY